MDGWIQREKIDVQTLRKKCLSKQLRRFKRKIRVKPMLILLKLKLILIPGPRAGRNHKGRILEDAERPVEVQEIKVNQYTLHRM